MIEKVINNSRAAEVNAVTLRITSAFNSSSVTGEYNA